MPGPLVVCVGALHGNEYQGIDAFEKVIGAIRKHDIHVKGTIVGIVGNIKALEQNKRYVDYDLNRSWSDAHINALKSGQGANAAEDDELLALEQLIKSLESSAEFTEKVLIDLHATSSEKGNFIVVPEMQKIHRVIDALHLPVVMELHKYLQGTLLEYYHEKNFVSFAFEGGMIGSEEAVDLHASGIWEILAAAGSISTHDQEDMDHYENKLKAHSAQLPKRVRAFHRHSVKDDDDFQMHPGYFNFKTVKEGEELAVDKHGPILAPRDSMIFMPLYQKRGDDGFFLVDEIQSEK